MTGRRWIWGALPLVLLAGLVVVVTQMGLLEGISGLSTSRNLELLPTVTAVQVGSANLAGLWTPFQIVDELRKYLETSGVANVKELVGAAQPTRVS